jgi:hypothetical protein
MTLTPQARKTLARHEKAIEKGLHAFVEAGKALAEIRDGDLYVDAYRTFDRYCELRWGMKPAHANRTINAAIVATHLTPIGVIPANEAQARPLTTVRDEDGAIDLEQVGELWQAAVEQAKESGATVPTAADVEKTVREWRSSREGGEGARPATGDPIPAEPDEEPLASPCPNCGGTERDDEGDCLGCRHPADEMGDAEEQEEPINEPFEALAQLVADWRKCHAVNPAIAAAYLENLAERLREDESP